MNTSRPTILLPLALALAACSDDGQTATDTKADSGADTGSATEPPGPTEAGDTGDSDTPTTTTPGGDSGPNDSGQDGEPPIPDDPAAEACDAGDEAFVKRVIPLVQGRKPEGMREVKLLVSMIEQLDAAGVDGRAVVVRGLASGDLYIGRWKQFLWEQLRINRVEVKSNYKCYSQTSGPNNAPDLAAYIRDNDANGSDFGQAFTMADVMESALRLDDMSPLYRADMFARMARPLGGANISQEEFEVNARSNFGEIFESAYLGRRSGCLECHNSEESVTYNPDPKFNHFWAIPGKFEAAIYGAAKGRPEAEIYAAFRVTGFTTDQGVRAWGMSSCGSFNPGHDGDILGIPGYLGGELPAGQNLFDLDPLFKSGFATLAADGLTLADNLDVSPDQALAYLTATNFVNNAWKEMMGYPLTLAHNFPRNEKQREILQQLTEAFVAEDYSLRAVITEIALNPYFNMDAPDACGTSTPYFMEPVFEPFSITSGDPNQRGNGVGDRVQRYSAWVLIESAMRSMWWNLPVKQIPANEWNFPAIDFLRDTGVFIKDAQNGFNGVDFNGLLAWENRLASGHNPGLSGDCTGPLGQGCSQYEWIELMLVEAFKADATIGEVAAAIKDRILGEPTIEGDTELAVIAGVIGFDPSAKMKGVDTVLLEEGARRYAGLLFNTPQFMLSGVPSLDQDPDQIPKFAVPGTDTKALCDHLAPAVLTDKYAWTCDAEGVKLSPK
ncbi:MAG TPA: hypothetical protein VGB85_01780 [Nannocystis sp.]|jgi:hypothetical protein